MSDQTPTAIQNRAARRAPLLIAALLAAGLSSACAPLILGGAMVGGGFVLTDRRTSGTQLEDQNIELKSGSRLREAVADRGNISITSYNRMVLISGEVPTEADRVAAEQAVAKVENVRGTFNELALTGNSSLTSRSNDAILLSKIKARFIDAADLQSNAIKVVVERGNAYLMGRVTEREASRATELTRGVGGVLKVIRLFELVSEAELAKMQPAEKK